jgi:multimeric flavodoxin WrbA
MKILALIGSPRKKSNTDLLTDEVLKGAGSKGHQSEKIYLYPYGLSPCIDCRKCKQGEFVCVLKDDMQELYEKIDQADLLIFGTPNYWFGPTAKMKSFIDRLRPYIASGKLKGKKAVVVIPAADGPEACGPMVEMFQKSFDYLGVQFAGKMLVTAYEKAEILKNEHELKKAYDLGASL